MGQRIIITLVIAFVALALDKRWLELRA